MSYDEEDNIIRRQFKHRDSRGTLQILYDVQRALTRPSGWSPPISQIVYRAERLNIDLPMFWR